jgi:GNAT superfamily N-acetyltransferase
MTAPSSTIPDIVVREYRTGDAEGIAHIGLENSAYYERLAPDYFKRPDEAGFVEFLEDDDEWRNAAENLALVAEVGGRVAGYLEASVQPPLDSARWQGQRDLAEPRLFINYVGTADAFKRMGVATRLVEAAEDWGRSKGAKVAICDTYVDSPLSMPFWEKRMGYVKRAVVFRKPLQ